MYARGLLLVAVLCAAGTRPDLVHAEEPALAGPGTPADFREVIQRAKTRVFPALVHVVCIREELDEGKRTTSQVGGSGVLVSGNGEFLTNWHVIDKAIDVRCMLLDGRSFQARILGADESTDVGLCRIDAPEGTSFPHALLGDSSTLVEGDFVMAMGAPWGLSRSVSLGIVSCTQRVLEDDSEYSVWLQTDASISPGNSGGPLVDTEGRVVGLNARGMRSGGDMGFAIPAATIADVIGPLRKHGRVPWSWMGLQLQPLQDFRRNMAFGGARGVIVAGTDPDSPARAAGLRPNDRLVAVDGMPVTARQGEDLPALRRKLGLLPTATTARLAVERGGEQLTIDVEVLERGRVDGDAMELLRWDFSVKQINRFAHPDMWFHRKQGVFVYGVKDPGNAETAGLRHGDILVRVGKLEVRTLEELRAAHEAAIKKLPEHDEVLLTVLRSGLQWQVVLDYGRDYERR
ncbi:MAG: trypsin-like peptidase domain-containing protein [Planctomycetota bacterium]